MSYTTNNISDSDRLLIVEAANCEIFKKLIPTISFLVILSTLGTTGNVLSTYIFITQMKGSLHNDLFTLLSVVNFLACSVSIPLDALDLSTMYVYPSVAVCKVGRFLNLFLMVVSTVTLATMAIFRLKSARAGAVVRYKKSVRIAGVMGLLLVSGSFSWTAAKVYGIKSIPTFVNGVMGDDCSMADKTEYTAWPLVLNVILIAGFGALTVVIIVSYYKIWRIVKASRLAVSSHAGLISILSHIKLEEFSIIRQIQPDSSEAVNGQIKSDSTEAANLKTDEKQPLPHTPEPPITTSNNAEIGDTLEISAITVVALNDNDIEKLVNKNVNKKAQKRLHLLLETHSVEELPPMRSKGHCPNPEPVSDISNSERNITADLLIEPDSQSFTGRAMFVSKTVPNSGAVGARLRTADEQGVSGVGGEKRDTSLTVDSGDMETRDLSMTLDSGDIEKCDIFMTLNSLDMERHDISKTLNHATDNNNDRSVIPHEVIIKKNHDLSIVQDNIINISYDKSMHLEHAAKDISDLLITTKQHCDELTNEQRECSVSPHKPADEPLARESNRNELKLSDKPKHKIGSQNSTHKAPKTSLETAITRTAFLLALTFVITYVPFILVSILRMFDRNMEVTMEEAHLNLVSVSVRLYFVMPAISPVIFWASSLDFRKKCRAMCARKCAICGKRVK